MTDHYRDIAKELTLKLAEAQATITALTQERSALAGDVGRLGVAALEAVKTWTRDTPPSYARRNEREELQYLLWIEVKRLVEAQVTAKIAHLEAEVAAQRVRLAQVEEFVNRCHELGATDTDIVKHALEDAKRLREEFPVMSQRIKELEAQQGIGHWTQAELDEIEARAKKETA